MNSFLRRRSFTTTASLLTYFRIPEQGMAEFEILSRSSLTIVETNSRRRIFLGPAHVTAPFDYRHYYKEQQWLDFLVPDHVQAFVGIHDANGTLQRKHELRTLLRHDSLDLVALELLNNNVMDDDLQCVKLDNEFDFSSPRATATELECVGFVQRDDLMLPTRVAGTFLRDFNARKFVKTESVLEQGMCGGPVVIRSTRNVVGLVEAIVSSQSRGPIGQSLVGCTSLIDKHQLNDFLKTINEN